MEKSRYGTNAILVLYLLFYFDILPKTQYNRSVSKYDEKE